MNQIYTVVPSPVGDLLLAGDGRRLRRLSFLGPGTRRGPAPIDPGWRRDDGVFSGLCAQLDEYFSGARREFQVELDLIGTEWELKVWNALLKIRYGETRAYGQIAAEVCTPAAARAVGLANGRNPVALIVPCHRVVGAAGSLTGYGGGLERKRVLLDLEAGRRALV
jgi:methylated-DNA-[protein]-cysteine S-methyltransferase